ncbi:hypothetical protein BD626DRAFT_428986 [Schizophyllum amplum]|uniref:Uncharacterized protein n=1 Tax=Schizophyllum amplum TaxID=97359 RepID=A0A550CIS2_9AGAR|nr:hypothetical protein BD626DRAFT_428986 [Auriculariopsis ampla]
MRTASLSRLWQASQASTAAAISSNLRDLCYNAGRTHQEHLVNVFEGILLPCLEKRSHYKSDAYGALHSVQTQYNDHEKLSITDYFSGLGYLLAHQQDNRSDLIHLIKLTSIYAQWCRASARSLCVNPPTVVQLLWETQPNYGDSTSNRAPGRFSLSSSVVPGKGDGREAIRRMRVHVLSKIWPSIFDNPTPVQKAHAEAGVSYAYPTEELFGTPWGHCGESITFASMYTTMQAHVPLGTLALSVKTMTSTIPGVGVSPAEAIMHLHRLQDVVEVLRAAGAMRPMCLNCQHLADSVSARVEDYASVFTSRKAFDFETMAIRLCGRH